MSEYCQIESHVVEITGRKYFLRMGWNQQRNFRHFSGYYWTSQEPCRKIIIRHISLVQGANGANYCQTTLAKSMNWKDGMDTVPNFTPWVGLIVFRQKHSKRRSQAASGFASCDPKMVPYHGFPGIIQQPKTNLSSNIHPLLKHVLLPNFGVQRTFARK